MTQERGTHAQLLALGGRYAQMWSLQQQQRAVADDAATLEAQT